MNNSDLTSCFADYSRMLESDFIFMHSLQREDVPVDCTDVAALANAFAIAVCRSEALAAATACKDGK
jgi:hypothetical protein